VFGWKPQNFGLREVFTPDSCGGYTDSTGVTQFEHGDVAMS